MGTKGRKNVRKPKGYEVKKSEKGKVKELGGK